jgi:hypothetical protein
LERSARPIKTDSDEFDVLSPVGEIISRIAEIICQRIAKLGSKPFRQALSAGQSRYVSSLAPDLSVRHLLPCQIQIEGSCGGSWKHRIGTRTIGNIQQRVLWEEPKPEHFIRTLVLLKKPFTGACHEAWTGSVKAGQAKATSLQPPTAGCQNKA